MRHTILTGLAAWLLPAVAQGTNDPQPPPVPEPGTRVLLAAGSAMAGSAVRHRRHR